VPGQPEEGHIPHKGKLSPEGKTLYVTYANGPGPNGGESGSVWKYDLTSGDWTNITPEVGTFGYGGLAVDTKQPDTLMVAAWNLWWPDTSQ
jgi:xyloglucan-specific exo-beta-1,4-glucanase